MIYPEYLEIVAPYNFWKKEIDTGIWRNDYVDRVLKTFSVPGTAVSVTGEPVEKTNFNSNLIVRL